MSSTNGYLQLSAQRGKAELCLDNDTVFRDASSFSWRLVAAREQGFSQTSGKGFP
jgi:hypothetical protein